MEEKELLEEMQDFRTNREEGLDENTKIVDVYYYGTIKINDEEKPVYRVGKDIDGSIRYEYYIDNSMIAIDELELIIPTKYSLMNNIDIKEIEENEEQISLNELEEKEEKLQEEKVEEIAEETGLENDEILNCVEMDANRQITFNAKTTIDTQRKVTATESLRDIIPGAEEYEKIAVIRSNTDVFTFVGMKANGEMEKIDSIVPTQGVNTGRTVTSINKDGSEVEEKQVSALAKVKGRENEGLSVRIGQYGIIETEYVRRTTENEYIGEPIENETQRPTKMNVKRVMDKTKNVRMNEEVDRANSEFEKDDKTALDNIDDTIENDNVNWEYEAGKAKVSVTEFRRIYEEVVSEMGSKISVKEAIEQTHETIEEQYLLPEKKHDEI